MVSEPEPGIAGSANIEVATNVLHFAVVVGINHYPGGFKELHGPVNDALAISQWLTDGSGGRLPQENVRLLLSSVPPATCVDDAAPTRQQIELALGSVRRAAHDAVKARPEAERADARVGTRLYFFVAGHGILPHSGQAALLDAQAQPDHHLNLELSDYVKYFVTDGTFAEVCVFADCCRTYELLAAPGNCTLNIPRGVGQQVFPLSVWAAAAGNFAFESPTDNPDTYRGEFSRALIDGLMGEAVDPSTGVVTSASLLNYADRVVRLRTADRPQRQQQRITPYGHMLRSMTFGPPQPVNRAYRKVQINFPLGFSGLVELSAPDHSITAWDAADGPWTVRIYDGLWAVQHPGSIFDGTGFAENGVFYVNGVDRHVQL